MFLELFELSIPSYSVCFNHLFNRMTRKLPPQFRRLRQVELITNAMDSYEVQGLKNILRYIGYNWFMLKIECYTMMFYDVIYVHIYILWYIWYIYMCIYISALYYTLICVLPLIPWRCRWAKRSILNCWRSTALASDWPSILKASLVGPLAGLMPIFLKFLSSKGWYSKG